MRRVGSIRIEMNPDDYTDEHGEWLRCDGRELSAQEYAELHALSGDWQSGNLATAFELPNDESAFFVGAGPAFNPAYSRDFFPMEGGSEPYRAISGFVFVLAKSA